jgi:hypothetical protein
LQTLTIDIPDELIDGSMTKADLESIAREALLVRLYDLGEVSSGKAAEILNISRRAFLDLLDSMASPNSTTMSISRPRYVSRRRHGLLNGPIISNIPTQSEVGLGQGALKLVENRK